MGKNIISNRNFRLLATPQTVFHIEVTVEHANFDWWFRPVPKLEVEVVGGSQGIPLNGALDSMSFC